MDNGSRRLPFLSSSICCGFAAVPAAPAASRIHVSISACCSTLFDSIRFGLHPLGFCFRFCNNINKWWRFMCVVCSKQLQINIRKTHMKSSDNLICAPFSVVVATASNMTNSNLNGFSKWSFSSLLWGIFMPFSTYHRYAMIDDDKGDGAALRAHEHNGPNVCDLWSECSALCHHIRNHKIWFQTIKWTFQWNRLSVYTVCVCAVGWISDICVSVSHPQHQRHKSQTTLETRRQCNRFECWWLEKSCWCVVCHQNVLISAFDGRHLMKTLFYGQIYSTTHTHTHTQQTKVFMLALDANNDKKTHRGIFVFEFRFSSPWLKF